jgi:hypothetical protein
VKENVARSHIKTHISLKVQLSYAIGSFLNKSGRSEELQVSIAFVCFYMICGHIEVYTSMSPRWIGGVCVYFNMILFTVPNSQIAFNKRMSTVNSF